MNASPDSIELSKSDVRAFAELLETVALTEHPTLRQRARVEVVAHYLANLVSDGTTLSASPSPEFASATETLDWPGVSGERPAGPDGYAYAFNGNGTVCGLAEAAIVVARQLFHPARLDACPSCRKGIAS